MKISATSVDEYLPQAPEDRQEALRRMRNLLRDHLPDGFSECLSYGMHGHVVPHNLFPPATTATPSCRYLLSALPTKRTSLSSTNPLF